MNNKKLTLLIIPFLLVSFVNAASTDYTINNDIGSFKLTEFYDSKSSVSTSYLARYIPEGGDFQQEIVAIVKVFDTKEDSSTNMHYNLDFYGGGRVEHESQTIYKIIRGGYQTYQWTYENLIIEVGGSNSNEVTQAYLNKYPSDILSRDSIGYEYSTWECRDGSKGEETSSSACKSVDMWLQYGKEACESKCNEAQGMCGLYTYKVDTPCDYDVCEDSDGGIDYYEKGTAFGSNSNPIYDNKDLTDNCYGPNNALTEFYCEDGQTTYDYYACPNGCKDGACVKEEEESCTDSDSGKNYYVKGSTRGYSNAPAELVVWEDCCRRISDGKCVSESTQLKETFCEDKWVVHESYNCPNGCKDGACLGEEPTIPIPEEPTMPIPEDEEEPEEPVTPFPEEEEEPATPIPEEEPIPACSGCITSENNCIPMGIRLKQEGKMYYCDIDSKLKEQKSEDDVCNNNFECSTNICINDKCISQGFIQKIMTWFKRIFGGK